ncbi:MAG: FmdE family protein [Bacteroidota bacterium]|nr:FmdE family protein [Bacteroidota bacterium]
MKKLFSIILVIFSLSLNLFAHSGKPQYHVIIDTDGAIDDMRTITMFLSGNNIRVLAITCSQGTLLPDNVFLKVKSLTSAFYCEGIPVGVSPKTDFELPVCSSFAQSIKWNENILQNTYAADSSSSLLNKITSDYEDKITLIALGSLKTYADWIKQNPNVIGKIEKIIWYNNHEITEGFNYKVSPESYEFIKNSGISLEIVSNVSNNLTINRNYITELEKCNSIYAQQIIKVHKQDIVKDKTTQNHLKLWDDLIPLYLNVPILFEVKTDNNVKKISLKNKMPEKFIYEIISKLLVSATQTNNRIFISFPTDTSLYLPEYSKMVNSTIEKYGLIEWKAVAMTNEIHGHTGIYSIIGAKMGIRAMEYYNVGINNMYVTTFAGNKPPLSCFNDGVQISSGATIGQGLITISDSISNIPTAIFEFNNRKVKISVKQEIAVQMQNDIKYAVKTYGLLTDEYWLYIEKLGIKYWTEFDRHEIFKIEEIKTIEYY